MKAVRFRIAWVMVGIAIAALDFAAIRAMLGSQAIILLLGALPMANVLAIGILVGQRRLRSRPFLLGFEAFGATALACFIAYATLSIFFHGGYDLLLNWYLAPVFLPLGKFIGQGGPFSISVELFVCVFMLGWPQVAFALIGGFLSRKFKVTITRR